MFENLKIPQEKIPHAQICVYCPAPIKQLIKKYSKEFDLSTSKFLNRLVEAYDEYRKKEKNEKKITTK